MAERRMFAKSIVDSDAFLDMPSSARLLYYDLGMRADDEGFVNNPKKIMRFTGASQQDLQVLMANNFIIPFAEKGLVVITDWCVHNHIRKDTFHKSVYIEEREQLDKDENGRYTLRSRDEYVTSTLRERDEHVTQISIDKVSSDKVSEEKKRTRFATPSLNDISEYCSEKGISIDGEAFIDYYSQQDWKLSNGNKMKNWQSAVNNWYRRQEEWKSKKKTKTDKFNDFDQRTYDDDLEGRLLEL